MVAYTSLIDPCFQIEGLADIVIAEITAGQINHYFAEIAPRTVYLLYGTPSAARHQYGFENMGQ